MKRHAFLILAHNQPNLLARTLTVLSAPNHHFFINIDAKSVQYREFKKIVWGNASNIHLLEKPIACYWAGISLVEAEIKLLQAAKSFANFDYYHLISGQDYPLRSNRQFDEFFENTEDSFMCYNFENDIDYWMPIYKNKTNHYYTNGKHTFWENVFLRIVNSRIGRILFKRKPIQTLAGGWQWFSWSAKVVEYVLEYLEKHPCFYRRFNHTSSPDEHFFTTLLYPHLEELKIRKHFPLRYVSWEPYRPIATKKRPYNMNEQDYDRVINSAAFFCRKVDEVESATLLDMIDAQRDNDYNINDHDYFF